MFKSLFSKLLSVFLLVTVISTAVQGVVLYFFLNDFVLRDKEKTLMNGADKVAAYFSDYMKNSDNLIYRAGLEWTMDATSSTTNSTIWLVDSEGYILKSMPQMSAYLRSELKVNGNVLKLPDERQYQQVMQGTGHITQIGDFYGFFKVTGKSWMTVETPLTITDAAGAKTTFAVYMHTSIPDIENFQKQLLRIFFLSMGLAALISSGIMYVLSRRMSRPIREIREAARAVSAGDFKTRLPVESQDEIGELAASFNAMTTALENLDSLRASFIANVSHELRTPMTTIRGFIEGILDETIPPERQKDYLLIVKDEVLRLNRLVTDLLDLAKMEAGELKLEMRHFNINEMVRVNIIKMERLFVDKQLELEAEFDEDASTVYADQDAIERVLINLLHNAVKFTPEGGRIRIFTEGTRDKVAITVEDSGIGIAPEELNRIWDRFYKADQSRGKDKTGTGLGLAIVRNIISEHHQKIEATSTPGKGTRFVFWLPRGKAL